MRVPEISLSQYDSYDQTRSEFEWDIPETFNAAESVCGQWARADDGKRRVALFYEDEDGTQQIYTFCQIQRAANQVSNALESLGVEEGTRVGVVLPQRPETLIANVAVLQCGAVMVPLSPMYGEDGLQYRLNHSGTELAIVGQQRAATVVDLREELDALETVVTLDAPDVDGEAWGDVVPNAGHGYETVETDAEDSAYIIYTSGTTGKPKGAHHAHRKLLGYIPGWQMINDFPGESAVHYTPAGWSWVGGLFAVVWGAWFHGQPVVGTSRQFDPEQTYELFERYDITNPLLTATMIRMLSEVDHEAYDLDLEVIPSGGEKVTPDLYEFVNREWGAVLEEIYGMTECNFVVGTNSRLVERNLESSGKPCPGHDVEIIDEETGELMPDGKIGHIVVKRPDPSMLLEYWDDPERTEELFVGDWMKTGDAGSRDADGYIYYEGRADEVIITSGYRVSPLEVEEYVREVEGVSNAVVVGVDDETRGTVVKAFVKTDPDVEGSADLADAVQLYVREQAAAYKYPREVEFVEEFPTTVSGKIKRYELTE
ncbi:acyl-CoA synthetase [Haladaptatus halobius]|uniref:acyl-CoA synthetase n=1 Tax=Haladaptatus halobius TaxID=2884875 RepID=UPI001D0B9401|nr:AMP-binding protein [Haladaptatus halobius]